MKLFAIIELFYAIESEKYGVLVDVVKKVDKHEGGFVAYHPKDSMYFHLTFCILDILQGKFVLPLRKMVCNRKVIEGLFT